MVGSLCSPHFLLLLRRTSFEDYVCSSLLLPNLHSQVTVLRLCPSPTYTMDCVHIREDMRQEASGMRDHRTGELLDKQSSAPWGPSKGRAKQLTYS
jgi:hypothetical protein